MRSVRTPATFRADALEAEAGLYRASKATLDVFNVMLDPAAIAFAKDRRK